MVEHPTVSLRLAHYDGARAQHLAPELTRLEEAAGSPDAQVRWLSEFADDDRFCLVTVAVGGRPVGYCAAVGDERLVVVQRLLVTPAGIGHEPHVTQTLIDAVIKVAAFPRPAVAIDADSPGRPHLHAVGWRPVADAPAAAGLVVLAHRGAEHHGR